MRAKELIINGKKKCLTCGESKPTSEYYRRKETQIGYIPYCKECYRKKRNEKNQLQKLLNFPF
jgi:NAD-dependent SIR2 family protein deacetylase